MKHLFTLFSILFISTFIMTSGQVINVPGDQPTIQAAINASFDGDTVLVADGTYYENIKYKGKAITVASWFLIDGDEAHIDSTIINGSQPSHPDSGSVVFFGYGEDTTSVLYGFTITGGIGMNPPEARHSAWGAGGIAIESGAKIIYNKIVFNTITTDNGYGYGGGILISPTKPVQIIKNIIANNKIIGIKENANGGGGGIFCYEVNFTELIIANNIITNNYITSNSQGGGIQFAHFSAKPDIRNNLIKNNYARIGGGLEFVDYRGSENIDLTNNTIINNHATDKGGAIFEEANNGLISIVNSILWGNTASTHSQIFSDVLGGVIAEYSNIELGYPGVNIMATNPLFADTINYYLTASSPCVDAGSPYAIYNDLEDPDNPGFPLPPALGTLRNDMGYCGGKGDIPVAVDDPKSNLPVEFTLSQNYPNPFNPTTVIQYSIPAVVALSTSTSLSTSSVEGLNQNSAETQVNLKIYDILGREVATLVNEHQRPGSYKVNFDASALSSGVYFYKLTAGNNISTKKMILLR